MTKGSEIDPRQFRSALGSFTTGVTIVTTRDASGRDIGLTVNSFNSVSLDPPLVLWSLAKNSRSLEAFANAEYFAVHILAAEQEKLSAQFASNTGDKFAGVDLVRGHGEIPLLPDCTARFECKTTYRYEGGDHEIFVGEVVVFESFDRAPLVFQKGGYAIAVKKPKQAKEQEMSEDATFRKDFLSHLLGVANAFMSRSVREAVRERNMLEDEYYLLAMLGMEDGRTREQLDAVMRLTGRRMGPDLVEKLLSKSLVQESEGGIFLTEAGRRLMIEFMAVAKSVEDQALNGIEHSEAQFMKQILRRIIRNLHTDSKNI